jgi:hypothetical protein
MSTMRSKRKPTSSVSMYIRETPHIINQKKVYVYG